MDKTEAFVVSTGMICLAMVTCCFLVSAKGCNEAKYQAELEARKAYAEAAANGVIIGDTKFSP